MFSLPPNPRLQAPQSSAHCETTGCEDRTVSQCLTCLEWRCVCHPCQHTLTAEIESFRDAMDADAAEMRCNDCGQPAKFIDRMQDGEEWQECAWCGAASNIGDPDAVYLGSIC